MATVRPFRAIRYDEKFDDLGKLVSPPYDVISASDRRALVAGNDHNFVRIILPEGGADRFEHAAKLLSEWREEGVLIQETEPALYLYKQSFRRKGEATPRWRRGLLCAVRLTPFGEDVLPHERTMSKPKEERLALLSACDTQLEPIFLLYRDQERRLETAFKALERTAPLYRFKDNLGDEHVVWRMSDERTLTVVAAVLAEKRLYVADGHHRYETALTRRDALAKERGGLAPDDPHNFCLSYLVNMEDREGLLILAAHRLLSGRHLDVNDFLSRAKDVFEIETRPIKQRHAGAVAAALAVVTPHFHRFGAYFGGKELYVLRLGDERHLKSLNSEVRTADGCFLDVTVLHDLVLNRICGIPSEEHMDVLSYTIDEDEALEAVDRGEASAAFFLNPTDPLHVRDVAERGMRMPGKATYFYPKPKSGVVVLPLDEPLAATDVA